MSTISSGTTLTTALVQTGDTTGDLVIKTGSSNTTAMTISGSNQSVTFAGAVNVSSSAFANGSASSPSITFTGDTNTGIFSPGADSIGFAEGGSEIARFDSSGNFGIGTTSPAARLHVVAPSTTAESLTWNAAAGQILRNENSELAIGLSNASPYNMYIQGRQNTNAARDIIVQPLGGNVGIGTTNPTYPLTVGNNKQIGGLNTGGSGVTFAIVNGSNNLVFGDDSVNTNTLTVQSRGGTIFNVNTAERMRITANGGVAFNGASNYGSSGQLLQSNGDAAPTWVTPTVNGTAKAWVSFNGTNGSIRGSFNVSSVSRNGTGEYTVNFTSALSTANYAKTCTPSGINGQGDLTAINTDRMNSSFTAPTTTAFKIWTKVIGSSQDPEYVSAAAFA